MNMLAGGGELDERARSWRSGCQGGSKRHADKTLPTALVPRTDLPRALGSLYGAHMTQLPIHPTRLTLAETLRLEDELLASPTDGFLREVGVEVVSYLQSRPSEFDILAETIRAAVLTGYQARCWAAEDAYRAAVARLR